MDTEYFGPVPLPEEGTEAFDALCAAEGCFAWTCQGDAYDPYEAAALYSGEGWCPGHCARYWDLTMDLLPEGSCQNR